MQWAGFEVIGQVFGMSQSPHSSRFTLNFLAIGLVTSTTANLLSAPLSGLMGLAFQSIASSNATPLWQTLAETSGTLDSPLMAVQLTRFTNDTSAQTLEPGGTFTIGAVETSLYTGDINYQDIPSGAPGYWIQSVAGEYCSG